MRHRLALLCAFLSALLAQHAPARQGLRTAFADTLDAAAPLPEYPRPHMQRDRWLSLNGTWQWSGAGQWDAPPARQKFDRTILVPFPVESALSGVAEQHDKLWYRRTFTVPADWAGQRIMLNFGAVDWEAVVYVNGHRVGDHTGGYDPFSFDITDALNPTGEQELVVRVYDPTDAGQQPRGKQVRKPEGIWYTPCTGIWQTVWIEPVPPAGISTVEIVPDLAMGVFKARVTTRPAADDSAVADALTVTVFADGTAVQKHQARPNNWFVLKPGKPRPWSPEDPFLYDIIIEHSREGKTIDVVKSYAGLRSTSLGKDAKGRTVLMLNGEPYFQVGPLDQGFWPDGIYTAPTDEALRYDVEITKKLGFNMTRKHVKVEPARWYYWADRLGLLVWQDMPSSQPYIGPRDPDATRSPESAAQFEKELAAMIAAFKHHPSIVMWVPFNEGWGQYDTARIVEYVRSLDPTRLVNNASGWTDRNVGDVIDWHRYPEPDSPRPEEKRAAVLGEYGGLGLAVENHLWKKENWGYKGMRDANQLTRTYESYMQKVYDLKQTVGLSAVVYTQLTDVEIECNGLLTYDRKVIKPDLERIAAANRGDFSRVPPPPVVTVVVPTSVEAAQTWRYTTDQPAAGWHAPAFDDSSWKEGPGGFGTRITPGATVRTEWNTRSIWARRQFELGAHVPKDLLLRLHHDEDCEVYLNGVLAIKLGGWTSSYEDFPIAPEALHALKPGTNTIAVHCRQTNGGQYIDAGLVTVHEAPAAPSTRVNAAPGQPQPNLLATGDFETPSTDGLPSNWRKVTWNGNAEHSYPGAGGRGKGRCVQISSQSGADASWSLNAPVEMMSRYRLSGWIKTADVQPIAGARGVLLNVHGMHGVETRPLTGTRDWTLVEVEFDTGENDSIMINCLFGGWGSATGQAWFDDISLTLLSRGTLPEPSITIDAAKVGEPVSKYIYGQFIEHLGRCIYGGIWAEMLEDRKFFHAVGANDSPWKPVAAAVTMSTENPFVGSHSPVVTLAGPGREAGIAQHGLHFKPGATYVGHVWLAGDAVSSASIAVSSPAWKSPIIAELPAVTADLRKINFTLNVDPAAAPGTDATFQILATGTGPLRIGTVSLMPGDNIDGFRPDTLALLKELDSPVYRWPGGNFVSGYDWRDGIGDRDRRPPRKNPAWKGVEHNDVGIHEFMDLCRLLNTDPYIAVNTGLGSVQSAVDQLQYVNGAADTPMGKLRAANGRPEPWNVKFWGIGNEMYGSWQLGNVPLDQYIKRHADFVTAMRAVDPSITVIGVGAVGEWSRRMLEANASTMDHISEHVYWQHRDGLAAHVRQAPDSLRHIAQAHRQYRRDLPSLADRDIRICQDEWNYWYGPEVFGELGTRYFMRDALGVAAALHEFVRNSDLFYMANYAQTVNVIGAIKVTPSAAALETTGLVLKLYRHKLGTLPVAVTAGPLIDAAAAWNQDRSLLTIAVVNPTMKPARIPLTISGATLMPGGRSHTIASDDQFAYNDPGSAPAITIKEQSLNGVAPALEVAPCSVTLFELPARP
ncbi:MAG: Beta-galactosidase [Phycisphaerales bacterium]|nr:Beta-galactosidase [Phycisphaerales bacterium]